MPRQEDDRALLRCPLLRYCVIQLRPSLRARSEKVVIGALKPFHPARLMEAKYMRYEVDGNLGPTPSEVQLDASASAEANVCIVDPPSSYLKSDDWRCIADSLGLSARHLDVVQGVFDGLDQASIGLQLGVSPHTVHSHLNLLYRNMGVNSRCELIVRVFLVYVANQARPPAN